MNKEPKTTVWLFDLDNTLHHADEGIFYLINRRMTAYLMRHLKLSESEADHLRRDYWHRYGATLAGLRLHHPETDIADFLRHSHPMNEILPKVRPVQGTADVLGRLKGRKAVFSNAPSFYVRGLAAELGLSDCFDALFGTDDFGLLYKPAEAAYLTVCAAMKTDPADCVMVDDSADNLAAAKKAGHENRLVRQRQPSSALRRLRRTRYGRAGRMGARGRLKNHFRFICFQTAFLQNCKHFLSDHAA